MPAAPNLSISIEPDSRKSHYQRGDRWCRVCRSCRHRGRSGRLRPRRRPLGQGRDGDSFAAACSSQSWSGGRLPHCDGRAGRQGAHVLHGVDGQDASPPARLTAVFAGSSACTAAIHTSPPRRRRRDPAGGHCIRRPASSGGDHRRAASPKSASRAALQTQAPGPVVGTPDHEVITQRIVIGSYSWSARRGREGGRGSPRSSRRIAVPAPRRVL